MRKMVAVFMAATVMGAASTAQAADPEVLRAALKNVIGSYTRPQPMPVTQLWLLLQGIKAQPKLLDDPANLLGTVKAISCKSTVGIGNEFDWDDQGPKFRKVLLDEMAKASNPDVFIPFGLNRSPYDFNKQAYNVSLTPGELPVIVNRNGSLSPERLDKRLGNKGVYGASDTYLNPGSEILEQWEGSGRPSPDPCSQSLGAAMPRVNIKPLGIKAEWKLGKEDARAIEQKFGSGWAVPGRAWVKLSFKPAGNSVEGQLQVVSTELCANYPLQSCEKLPQVFPFVPLK